MPPSNQLSMSYHVSSFQPPNVMGNKESSSMTANKSEKTHKDLSPTTSSQMNSSKPPPAIRISDSSGNEDLEGANLHSKNSSLVDEEEDNPDSPIFHDEEDPTDQNENESPPESIQKRVKIIEPKNSWGGFEHQDSKLSRHKPTSKSIAVFGPFLHQKACDSVRKLSLKKLDMKRLSDFNDIAYMADTMEGFSLSIHQQSLLKEAWAVNSRQHTDTSAMWIFTHIFSRRPTLQTLFGLPNNSFPTLTVASSKVMQANTKFLKHAVKFSDVLDMCIQSVDSLDNSLGPMLFSYGSKHVDVIRDRPELAEQFFKEEDWKIFAEAMCEYAATWRIKHGQRVETLMAWRILVFFITSKVKQGFHLEMEKTSLKSVQFHSKTP